MVQSITTVTPINVICTNLIVMLKPSFYLWKCENVTISNRKFSNIPNPPPLGVTVCRQSSSIPVILKS